MGKRIHYIDWLRVLAVLLLFPFHVSRVFDYGEPFYVKAASTSPLLLLLLAFIDKWHMPLLFALAGASTCLALGRRTSGQYLAERVKRLLVPLVFGFFVLIPPQTWIGGRFNSGYSEPFWRYMASGDFLRWNVQDAGDYYGGFGIGHLWFILFLFVVSLLALPLIAWFRGERGSRAAVRMSRGLANPLWWLVPALLLWLAEGLADIAGKPPLFYLVLFVLGYLAMADGAFMESAERFRWPATIVGALLCAAYSSSGQLRDSMPDPSWPLFAANLLGMLGTWAMVAGLMGLGRRHLDSPSPALSYLAEASYPVYIIHQTAIVVLAVPVISIGSGWPLEWAILLMASVAVTFAAYEVIRRVAPLRFLFGMKPASAAAKAAG